MTTFTQNVGRINSQAAKIQAASLNWYDEETPFLARPNHPYWRLRVEHFGPELHQMINDPDQWEAFWAMVDDNASFQQISKTIEREIAKRRASARRIQEEYEFDRMLTCADWPSASTGDDEPDNAPDSHW